MAYQSVYHAYMTNLFVLMLLAVVLIVIACIGGMHAPKKSIYSRPVLNSYGLVVHRVCVVLGFAVALMICGVVFHTFALLNGWV